MCECDHGEMILIEHPNPDKLEILISNFEIIPLIIIF